MAHAAASAVARTPGEAYHLLFLYGGVGVGKTHLMNAVGHEILRVKPDTEMVFCSGEEFMNELVAAIQTKRTAAFKNRYRSVKVFLVDDIQFIAGKDAVQEEKLGGRYVGIEYKHLLADVLRELQESIELGLAAGVAEEKIIIDNGIGFGKTVEQNLKLLNQLDEFRVLGRPILIGPSRKSFIGFTLDLPPYERVEGTAATVALGVERGADIVRDPVDEPLRLSRSVHGVRAITGCVPALPWDLRRPGDRSHGADNGHDTLRAGADPVRGTTDTSMGQWRCAER